MAFVVNMQTRVLSQAPPAPAKMATSGKMHMGPAPCTAKPLAKCAFFGPSLPASRKLSARARCQRQAVAPRAAGKETTIEVDKPLGLKFTESKAPGGGLKVTDVSGNAAKSGIAKGDTIIYTSSFFGDELWPADKPGFSKSAINACPSPVCFVYVKGDNADVNVKRLPKRPVPPRFGRKLTAAQRETATHICVDCGWIYFQKAPFDSLPDEYQCPQCSAYKKRFAPYDPATGKAKGRLPDQIATVATVIGGLVGVGVLGYLGLTLSAVN